MKIKNIDTSKLIESSKSLLLAIKGHTSDIQKKTHEIIDYNPTGIQIMSVLNSQRAKLFKKIAIYSTATIMGGYGTTEYGQRNVNNEHADYNHFINIEQMSNEEKILQLIGTTNYDNQHSEQINSQLARHTGR